MYQVRYDGGALAFYDSLEEAIKHNNGEWDKVSWDVGEHGRMILRSDCTWEWRTPESLLREVKEEV